MGLLYDTERVVVRPGIQRPNGHTGKIRKANLTGSSRALDCESCGLYKNCLSPKMFPTGDGQKGILIIAEAPGRTEDEKGIQLIGEAGQLLRRVLRDHDVDLDRDCRKTNSLSCRPEGNRTPTSKEIAACRSRVWEEIRSFQPKLIILLGNAAVESFLGHRWKKDLGGINKWRGFAIPDRETRCWVVATFHPSFLLRSQGNPAVETVFRQDIELAMEYLDRPFPEKDEEEKHISIIQNSKQAVERLRDVFKKAGKDHGSLVAFDYETTGLKPYNNGHRIVCCGVAYNTLEGSPFIDDRAFVFEMTDDSDLRLWWKRILMSEKIRKSAHNLKFEDTWTNVILGHAVNGWEWCSMQAAHVLDNRSDVTGLKFQAYVNFGIVDYASEIDPFLRSDDSSDNAFNQIGKAPLRDLMRYCGMDALFQLRLARKQMKQMKMIGGSNGGVY